MIMICCPSPSPSEAPQRQHSHLLRPAEEGTREPQQGKEIVRRSIFLLQPRQERFYGQIHRPQKLPVGSESRGIETCPTRSSAKAPAIGKHELAVAQSRPLVEEGREPIPDAPTLGLYEHHVHHATPPHTGIHAFRVGMCNGQGTGTVRFRWSVRRYRGGRRSRRRFRASG